MEQEPNMQEEPSLAQDDELTLDDLEGNYIKNPPVGESIEFTTKKVKQITGSSLIVKKKDGGSFSKALSKVDYGIEVITDKDATYTVSAWEVWGKMKNAFKKLKTMNGVSFRITHIKDGMKERNGDSYKVEVQIDGSYKTLDKDTNEWV